ncbi:MAG: hypothetical protein DIU79_07700 [Actinobacteria bacterium]|nr:MAG: hypothetical protein DIU79_07700 [Actinomycetota bacterium]
MVDRDLRHPLDSRHRRPHWSVGESPHARPEWPLHNAFLPERRRVNDHPDPLSSPTQRSAERTSTDRAPRARFALGRHRLDTNKWHWLLLIPVIVPLSVPLYNRIEPTLGGVPFYYWAQLSFALLATVVVAIVHVATKDR